MAASEIRRNRLILCFLLPSGAGTRCAHWNRRSLQEAIAVERGIYKSTPYSIVPCRRTSSAKTFRPHMLKRSFAQASRIDHGALRRGLVERLARKTPADRVIAVERELCVYKRIEDHNIKRLLDRLAWL